LPGKENPTNSNKGAFVSFSEKCAYLRDLIINHYLLSIIGLPVMLNRLRGKFMACR
jgi:hypothetical protein